MWKKPKYGVFSGPYVPIFGQNTESCKAREDTDQKKLRIQTLSTDINPFKTSVTLYFNDLHYFIAISRRRYRRYSVKKLFWNFSIFLRTSTLATSLKKDPIISVFSEFSKVFQNSYSIEHMQRRELAKICIGKIF